MKRASDADSHTFATGDLAAFFDNPAAFSDITIRLLPTTTAARDSPGGRLVRAHQVILAARSPKLKAILAVGTWTNGELPLTGADPDALFQALRYLYTGDAARVLAEAPLSRVIHIFDAADKLEIHSLSQAALQQLARAVTPADVPQILEEALVLRQPAVVEELLGFCDARLPEVLAQSSFQLMGEQTLAELLAYLAPRRVRQQQDLVDAANQWCQGHAPRLARAQVLLSACLACPHEQQQQQPPAPPQHPTATTASTSMALAPARSPAQLVAGACFKSPFEGAPPPSPPLAMPWHGGAGEGGGAAAAGDLLAPAPAAHVYNESSGGLSLTLPLSTGQLVTVSVPSMEQMFAAVHAMQAAGMLLPDGAAQVMQALEQAGLLGQGTTCQPLLAGAGVERMPPPPPQQQQQARTPPPRSASGNTRQSGGQGGVPQGPPVLLRGGHVGSTSLTSVPGHGPPLAPPSPHAHPLPPYGQRGAGAAAATHPWQASVRMASPPGQCAVAVLPVGSPEPQEQPMCAAAAALPVQGLHSTPAGRFGAGGHLAPPPPGDGTPPRAAAASLLLWAGASTPAAAPAPQSPLLARAMPAGAVNAHLCVPLSVSAGAGGATDCGKLSQGDQAPALGAYALCGGVGQGPEGSLLGAAGPDLGAVTLVPCHEVQQQRQQKQQRVVGVGELSRRSHTAGVDAEWQEPQGLPRLPQQQHKQLQQRGRPTLAELVHDLPSQMPPGAQNPQQGSDGGGRAHAGAARVSCCVEGCTADLTVLREYYQRFKICEFHLKLPSIVRDGIVQRFCQQCGRFHSLERFDGTKRSCRARLDRHNARRRKGRATATHADLLLSLGSQPQQPHLPASYPAGQPVADELRDRSAMEEDDKEGENKKMDYRNQHDTGRSDEDDTEEDEDEGQGGRQHPAAGRSAGGHEAISSHGRGDEGGGDALLQGLAAEQCSDDDHRRQHAGSLHIAQQWAGASAAIKRSRPESGGHSEDGDAAAAVAEAQEGQQGADDLALVSALVGLKQGLRQAELVRSGALAEPAACRPQSLRDSGGAERSHEYHDDDKSVAEARSPAPPKPLSAQFSVRSQRSSSGGSTPRTMPYVAAAPEECTATALLALALGASSNNVHQGHDSVQVAVTKACGDGLGRLASWRLRGPGHRRASEPSSITAVPAEGSDPTRRGRASFNTTSAPGLSGQSPDDGPGDLRSAQAALAPNGLVAMACTGLS